MPQVTRYNDLKNRQIIPGQHAPESTIYNGWLKEEYSGGMAYTIDAASVSITEASSSKILGTYQFTLKNAAGSKTTTGTFTINEPAQ